MIEKITQEQADLLGLNKTRCDTLIEQANAIQPQARPEPVSRFQYDGHEELPTPEPTDPHAADRIKYAKQVAEGTVGFYLWEYETAGYPKQTCINAPEFRIGTVYRCTDISCYVSKDGEPAIRMLRTEAQKLQAETLETCDWFEPNVTSPFDAIFMFITDGIYTYKRKALKPVSWESMPKGVRIQYRTDLLTLRHVAGDKVWLEDLYETPGIDGRVYADVALAPADKQPWIAVQDDQNRVGLILDFGKAGLCYEFDVYRYKITGLAEGYVLEGAKPTGVLTK